MSDVFVQLILNFIRLLLLAIFAQIILSWLLVAGMRHELVLRLHQALTAITDPLMRPIRRIVPNVGMIDITPMIAIILLAIMEEIVRATLL